jgi:tetratricopeptide (TPR) repeat protein
MTQSNRNIKIHKNRLFEMRPILAIGLFMISWTFLKADSPLTPTEQQLQKDIEDTRLDDFSKIEAAFILSGVVRPDSLKYYVSWYNALVDKIKGFPFDRFDRVEAANQVFSYLHTTWLKQYKRESTDLLAIVRKQEYNCVAATILYNLICEDLGWITEAFETPTHVYTIFSNFTQQIAVENTNPMGFNVMRNLHEYSQYLARYYPEKEIYRIGLDRLYAYENSKGRLINNTELLGLLAYNRAYFARKDGRYARAYELVLLAQCFNVDSRSNVSFEQNLYYIWGKQLFDNQRYREAFSVFADALYRYPDNHDFLQNTRATFFLSLNQYWHDHLWVETTQLINEFILLDVMTEEDCTQLNRLLDQWQEGSGLPETDEILKVRNKITPSH